MGSVKCHVTPPPDTLPPPSLGLGSCQTGSRALERLTPGIGTTGPENLDRTICVWTVYARYVSILPVQQDVFNSMIVDQINPWPIHNSRKLEKGKHYHFWTMLKKIIFV